MNKKIIIFTSALFFTSLFFANSIFACMPSYSIYGVKPEFISPKLGLNLCATCSVYYQSGQMPDWLTTRGDGRYLYGGTSTVKKIDVKIEGDNDIIITPTSTTETINDRDSIVVAKTYNVSDIFPYKIFARNLEFDSPNYNNKSIKVYFDNELVIKGMIKVDSHLNPCPDFSSSNEEGVNIKYIITGIVTFILFLALIYYFIRGKRLIVR